MHIFTREGDVRKPIGQMSFMQTKQAAAIMDCIGRMIPQEGVDYDMEVIFNGRNSSSVSMNIVALTDKGEWWRRYVMDMMKKYPPKIENPEEAIQETPPEELEKMEGEKKDAQVVP